MSSALSSILDTLIQVPSSARTLAGFRAWAVSDDFPSRGRISYVQGELLIDMSAEELESHNKVKSEVCRVVGNITHDEDLGTYYSDRTLLTNEAAGLSTEPDATFASWEAFQLGRLRCVPREGRPGEHLELEGAPDWVLEVVSRSSVKKDTELLLQTYHVAGIPEYWLIDARGSDVSFRILIHHSGGYRSAPARSGWIPSRVFGRSFRLRRERDRLGNWKYTLEARK